MEKMTYVELAELVRSGTPAAVACRKGVEDLEGYPEAGMRARVVAVGVQRDDVSRITLDYTEFDDFNKAFETSNYFDKDHKPNLTARQAGFYKLQEELYVMTSEPVEVLFELLPTPSLALFAEYRKASPELGYTSWLEGLVLQLRGDQKS